MYHQIEAGVRETVEQHTCQSSRARMHSVSRAAAMKVTPSEVRCHCGAESKKLVPEDLIRLYRRKFSPGSSMNADMKIQKLIDL